MKKEGKKTIVRLNRIALYCSIWCCIIGVAASSAMFFILDKEINLPEETDIFRGQMLFIGLAVLLVAATVYCISKWWVTVSFSEHNVRYHRIFRKTYVRSYKYYNFIYFGYKAKTGNLIAESRKTYYILITRNMYDAHELKHVDKIETSYKTIKLIYSDGLCRNLYKTFPDTHKKMLTNAINGIKKDSSML